MRKTGNSLFFFALTLFLLRPSFALADVSISASVDRNKVPLNESFQISVTISGTGNVPNPQMPDLANFTVASSGRNQNISFTNGQMSSSVTNTYVLTPKSAGKFTIGGFSVTIDGKTVQSQPVEIEVTAAAPVPSPGAPQQQAASNQPPGAFIKMSVDKSKIYLNEQAILSFRFYYRVRLMAQPQYSPPEKTGFIFEELTPPREFVENVRGAAYHVSEIKTALFPTKTGSITIPPAGLKITVPVSRGGPFDEDFFNQFFGPSGREYLLKSEPVQITVLPLPSENKPKDFSGGVGEFKISASADKSKLSIGEPLTLSVTIEGSGNLKSLNDPAFPPFTGFRKYDSASSLNIDNSKGNIQGSKVYKIVLIPQISGPQTIPPIPFSAFDLASKKYRTSQTSAISLEVSQSKSTGVVISPLSFAPSAIQQIHQEIRYIKQEPLPSKSFRWMNKRPWFVPLHLIPILGWIGACGYRWRRYLIEKDPEKRRFLTAYKRMKQELAQIEKTSLSAGEKSSKIFEILRNYFADKMQTASAGLTFKAVEGHLVQSGLPESILKELKSLWNDLEFSSYAPSQFHGADAGQISKTVSELIQKIDSALSKSGLFFKTIMIFVPLAMVSAAFTQIANPNEKFQQANHLYQDGQFEQAKSLYEEIKNDGVTVPALEYNLGNVSYKTGHPGEAIASWIRTWRMNPRDGDVWFNLSLVSTQTGDSFFSSSPLVRMVEHIFYALNLNELSVITLLLLWISCGVTSWTILQRNKFWQMKIFLILGGLILTAAWWLPRFYVEQVRITGVVTVPKAEVRSGPGKQFGVGFTIPEGRRVFVMQNTDGDWIEIGSSQEGVKGWVRKEEITQID